MKKEIEAIRAEIEQIRNNKIIDHEERAYLFNKLENLRKVFEERRKEMQYMEIWRIEKQLDEIRNNFPPFVGMPCTVILYSDTKACRITEVKSNRQISVRYLETKCIDFYASRYEILDTFENWPEPKVFTKRKSGVWCKKGHPDANGSVYLGYGYMYHYIDPCF